MTHTKNSEEIIATLVKLADSLDQEGKPELAEEVDSVLKNTTGPTDDTWHPKKMTIGIKELQQLTSPSVLKGLEPQWDEQINVERFQDYYTVSHRASTMLANVGEYPEFDKLFEQQAKRAAEEDNRLQSFAARPKAPLKGLEDSVKKGLIAFLYKAEKNLSDSTTGLDEFCRRLRYFDVADIVAEMGLDKVIKDMNKVHMDMEIAVRKFYEATHGKKPGKNDIETMMADDKASTQKPQEFFESQKKSNEMTESDIFSRDEKGERVPRGLDKVIKCEDCGEDMAAKVLKSGGGYYLGRECQCGPYSRDSKYFKSPAEAEEYLKSFKPEIKEQDDTELTETDLEDFWKDYGEIN